MTFEKDWVKRWRSFFEISRDRDRATIEILRLRYVEETQGIAQLTRHAHKMHYPQFCRKLLDIAAMKSKHAEWIGERLVALGAKLPEVTERRSKGENSWQYLLNDLAEAKRSADRLPEQLWRIASDHPEISKLLQRIFDAETIFRQDISAMVMRSDGFALSLA
jgi:bacterioferritin (cytochrome b1)